MVEILSPAERQLLEKLAQAGGPTELHKRNSCSPDYWSIGACSTSCAIARPRLSCRKAGMPSLASNPIPVRQSRGLSASLDKTSIWSRGGTSERTRRSAADDADGSRIAVPELARVRLWAFSIGFSVGRMTKFCRRRLSMQGPPRPIRHSAKEVSSAHQNKRSVASM